VGNAEFVEIYNSMMKRANVKVWRIVNQYDLVPLVPLLTLGYRHVGNLVYYPPGPSVPTGTVAANTAVQPLGTGMAAPKFCGISTYVPSANSIPTTVI